MGTGWKLKVNTGCIIVEFELQAEVNTEHIFLFYWSKCQAGTSCGNWFLLSSQKRRSVPIFSCVLLTGAADTQSSLRILMFIHRGRKQNVCLLNLEAFVPSANTPRTLVPCPTLNASPKMQWANEHQTTWTMVGPAVLSLPYALRGIGWALGLATLTVLAAVSFYTYYVMSRVLDRCEAAGRRHIRFRDLAADVLGSGWAFYLMVAVQGAINVGVTIGSILLAGNSLQIMYASLVPDGPLKLHHFIIAVASVLALLSQMPSFHSLRYINLGSLVLSICYTILVSASCIRAGLSSNAPAKDYSLSTSKSEKTFDAFLSVSILAAAFGNGILPEIQATLVPPAVGKMVKALVINYSVAFFTFYPLAITGYWAFGKTVRSNAIQSLMPDGGPSLAPRWLLCLTVVLVLFQLLAIALLYAQVVYEVMEKRVADAARGRFSCRNLLPRVAMRTLYVALCAFVAAALPFFGEIVGVIGVVGYIPLDFILPVVMYNMVVSPPRRSVVYVTNVAIMVLFTGLGVIGAVASVRKLVLNAGRFKLFNDHVVK